MRHDPDTDVPTAALILAAGASRRLGRTKQLLTWGSTTLLEYVIERTLGFGIEEVWVVLGHDSDEILETVDFHGSSVVINPEYDDGIASSMRVGLDALTRSSKADAVMILMGDQPDIRSDVVEALLAEARSSEKPAVVPKYRYTWSNPAVIARVLWPRLMSLEGDTGAKKLLQAHPEWVDEVWSEHLPPRDVDTEEDVTDLRPRTTT